MENKEFVPYEQTIALKELGFDIPSISGYSYHDEHLIAQGILYQQAFRWFRERYKLFSSIEYSTTNQTDFVITINKRSINDARDEEYKTYEEAELACLEKLIEMVKTKSYEAN